jgi:septum formation inhibitor-activating ATPase MinD
MKAKQRRFVYGLMACSGFRDRGMAETVNKLEKEELMNRLKEKFDFVEMDAVSDIEKGEVMTDSRGRGSMQTIPKPIEDRLSES